MFSIADLLDRAKAREGLPSDYRLAKNLGVAISAVYGYRSGKSLPDERLLARLCQMSGDDFGVVAAEIQAERAKTEEGKSLWLAIAERLRAGAAPVTLSALIAMNVVALGPIVSEDGEVLTAPPPESTNYASYGFAAGVLYALSMVLRRERRKNRRANSPRFFALENS